MKKIRTLRYVSILMAAIVLVACLLPSASLAAQTRSITELTGDNARVTNVNIERYITGTAPWDTDDAIGNDSGSANMIVRSFDSVAYTFTVVMSSYDAMHYEDARVKLEFVLPYDKEQVTFDISSMAWMDSSNGYEYTIKNESRVIGGKTTACQVLTCYKHLLPSGGNLSVIPGEFSENLSVMVGNMKNGEQFAPIISACMEYGTWDGVCVTHGVAEKVSAVANPVTISAAPKYNVKIAGTSEFRHNFDFNTGNTSGEYKAANYGKGTVLGRAIHINTTLQLYNDYPSKKMKGIELPDGGPITFDIKLSSNYTTESTGEKRDITADYMPLLYSCDELMSNVDKIDGRTIPQSVMRYFSAPQNRGTGTASCYDGGNWSATQQGDIISVTIKNYKINMDQMPTQDLPTTGIDYGVDKGIGCFSSGDFWIVQPFNKIGSTNTDEQAFDIVNDYGTGTFNINCEVKSLKATSVGGTVMADTAGTNDAQMAKNDDRYSTGIALALAGKMSNVVFYSNIGNTRIVDRGIDGTYDQYRNGLDAAFVGGELMLCGGFSYTPQNEEQNRIYYATNLLKFYAEPFEMTGKEFKKYNMATSGFEYDYLYATKPDGKDWTNDEELTHTYEDDLVFYSSLDDIPTGHKCVGVLYVFKGPASANASPASYLLGIGVKVKQQNDLVSKAYAMASTSRLWSKKHFDDAQMQLQSIPVWTDASTSLSDFPADHYKSANIDNQVYYRRETYAADGSGALGTHNSDRASIGDTLLIIGYNSAVSKSLLQMANGSEIKTIYNIDADQRFVDFVLKPSVTSDTAANAFHNKTTSVTIVDTLPEYVSYVKNSAYLGGTYNQTDTAGGTRGSVTGGTAFEPTATQNADGTTTLTWVISDAVVDTAMLPIYYTVYIGDKTDASKDVPIGTTNLSTGAYVTATGDIREPSALNGKLAEVGFKATKGAAISFGKYAEHDTVEADGTAKYIVYFNNNAGTPETDIILIDTMPCSGQSESDFTGGYTVSELKIDTAKCDVSKLKLYYTMDEAYNNKVASDLTVDAITANWTEATIAADGTVEALAGKCPIAWAIVGELEGHRSIYAELSMLLAPEYTATRQNVYYNRLSYKTSVIGADVTTSVTANVVPTPIPTPTPTPTPKPDAPKPIPPTGDASVMTIAAMLFALSSLAFIASGKKIKI